MKSSCLDKCLTKVMVSVFLGYIIFIGVFYVRSYKQNNEHEKFMEAEQAQCDAYFADMILPKLDYLPYGVEDKREINTRLVRNFVSWEEYSCWLYISYPKYRDADIEIIFVSISQNYLTKEWSCYETDSFGYQTRCSRDVIIINLQFDIETTQRIAERLYFDSE